MDGALSCMTLWVFYSIIHCPLLLLPGADTSKNQHCKNSTAHGYSENVATVAAVNFITRMTKFLEWQSTWNSWNENIILLMTISFWVYVRTKQTSEPESLKSNHYNLSKEQHSAEHAVWTGHNMRSCQQWQQITLSSKKTIGSLGRKSEQ